MHVCCSSLNHIVFNPFTTILSFNRTPLFIVGLLCPFAFKLNGNPFCLKSNLYAFVNAILDNYVWGTFLFPPLSSFFTCVHFLMYALFLLASFPCAPSAQLNSTHIVRLSVFENKIRGLWHFVQPYWHSRVNIFLITGAVPRRRKRERNCNNWCRSGQGWLPKGIYIVLQCLCNCLSVRNLFSLY